MIMWSNTVFRVPAGHMSSIPPSRVDYVPLACLIPRAVTEVMRDGRRWYQYDGHLYPSISTLLSATDNEGQRSLKEWRKRVGTTKAAEITRTAAARGTRWHTFCEKFILREAIAWTVFTEPTDATYAAHVATILNQQIARVIATETRVVSTRYGVAGRLDMAVELPDGRAAILDFKTGSKQKHGNRLQNYALQATFYADALSEQRDVPIETIVIAQLLPDAIVWQESHVSHWRSALQSRIASYAEQLNLMLG